MGFETKTVITDGARVKIPGRMVGDIFYPSVEIYNQSGQVTPTGMWMGPALTFTIVAAADGSAVTPVDLGANYRYLAVKCEDCQYIQGATTITAEVGYEAADTISDLYAVDDPSTAWSIGALPTTGTLAFGMTYPFAVRRIRFILSNAASGGSVVFKIYGVGRMDSSESWGSGLGDKWEDMFSNWELME